ncbi:T9SS type A sorting domain-containing protein [Fibrobacter sp.]|uniref:T9SS type A sorting domain-containing protein n=1 Tax=Fibrobacter sp. TaxID=35828 RepID=UPI00388F8D80
MKKMISLAIALFFATTALAQEVYVPSQDISETVKTGALKQTVMVGDNIKETKIEYTKAKGLHKADGFTQLGLSASCTANQSEKKVSCTVSGEIKRNLDVPTTINPYIIIEDEYGKVVITEFTFNLTARPTTLKIIKGEANQSVKAGEAISTIQIEYYGIKKFIYSGKPTGINVDKDNENQIITVSGKFPESTIPNVYKFHIYGVKAENEKDTLDLLLTFDVSTDKPVTVSATENKTQKVFAGDSIKPVVFSFTGANDYKIITVPPGKFSSSADADDLTVKVWGLVAGNTPDGMYTIEIEVTDGKTTAKAQASVEVESESSSSQSSSSEEDPESSSSVSSSSEQTDPESSSSAKSSSSEETVSSSSKETSSSSETTKPTSSSSETTKPESSSSEKTVSSSSDKAVSSSSKETSSSSETTKPTSSSSETTKPESSSSEKTVSSSSDKAVSSSSKETSSSSEKTAIIATVVPSFEFGFVNNELTVVLPKPAMLRVQVFDMMGHRVETFAESVVSSKSFNLAHLNMGNYVVRIESERYARTAKILVK